MTVFLGNGAFPIAIAEAPVVTGRRRRQARDRAKTPSSQLSPDSTWGQERRAFENFIGRRRRELLLPVPIGSPEIPCATCGTLCYSVVTESGKLAMVSCDVEFGLKPTEVKGGMGKSHVAVCAGRRS